MNQELLYAAEELQSVLLFDESNDGRIEAATNRLACALNQPYLPYGLKATGIVLMLLALLAKRVAQLEASC